jgi:hypothetical protein
MPKREMDSYRLYALPSIILISSSVSFHKDKEASIKYQEKTLEGPAKPPHIL